MKREDQHCWNCDFWKPYEEEDRDPDYDRGGYCGEPSPLEWEQGDHGASPPWVHSGAWCWKWEEYREKVMPDEVEKAEENFEDVLASYRQMVEMEETQDESEVMPDGANELATGPDVAEAGECPWGGHSKWCDEGCTCFFSDGAPMPEATDCPIHGTPGQESPEKPNPQSSGKDLSLVERVGRHIRAYKWRGNPPTNAEDNENLARHTRAAIEEVAKWLDVWANEQPRFRWYPNELADRLRSQIEGD